MTAVMLSLSFRFWSLRVAFLGTFFIMIHFMSFPEKIMPKIFFLESLKLTHPSAFREVTFSGPIWKSSYALEIVISTDNHIDAKNFFMTP